MLVLNPKYRYNESTSNGIAVLFIHLDGEPRVEHNIYSKLDKPVIIPFISKYVARRHIY